MTDVNSLLLMSSKRFIGVLAGCFTYSAKILVAVIAFSHAIAATGLASLGRRSIPLAIMGAMNWRLLGPTEQLQRQ